MAFAVRFTSLTVSLLRLGYEPITGIFSQRHPVLTNPIISLKIFLSQYKDKKGQKESQQPQTAPGSVGIK
jgi:hypothetical protein